MPYAQVYPLTYPHDFLFGRYQQHNRSGWVVETMSVEQGRISTYRHEGLQQTDPHHDRLDGWRLGQS